MQFLLSRATPTMQSDYFEFGILVPLSYRNQDNADYIAHCGITNDVGLMSVSQNDEESETASKSSTRSKMSTPDISAS